MRKHGTRSSVGSRSVTVRADLRSLMMRRPEVSERPKRMGQSIHGMNDIEDLIDPGHDLTSGQARTDRK